MLDTFFRILQSEAVGYVLFLGAAVGALITAYIENIIPFIGLVILIPSLGILAILAAALATGDTEAFFRELFQ